MAKKVASKNCSHCGVTVIKNNSINADGMPGHFCEHCGKPLDMVAFKNTNFNVGNDSCRAELRADYKVKVESFMGETALRAYYKSLSQE